jgi:hypothetical protein
MMNAPFRHSAAQPPRIAMSARLARTLAACADPDAARAALGGDDGLRLLARRIDRFPDLGRGPIAHDMHAPDVAQARFIACVRDWKPGTNRRPGLPQLALGLLRDKGIDFDNPDTAMPDGLSPPELAIMRALLLTGARAEVNHSLRGRRDNPYHNPIHTAHVATMAGYLGDLNDQLVEGYGRFAEYTMREKLLILLAAFAHDIDHPGTGNPPGDPYANERGALAAATPIMKAAGMHDRDIARVETMILTTSPNGPHERLKTIAADQAGHRGHTRPDPNSRFPELEQLCADRELTQMAAILSDADLFASAGTGFVGNMVASERLSREFNRNAAPGQQSADFTTPQARAGFLQHIVGRNGFASQAAMAGFNNYYRNFVAQNDKLLKNPNP